MRVHRAFYVATAFSCLAFVAVAPATGCDGTGTTPKCDFPDGANNPESGCGELLEAAPSVPDAEGLEDVVTADSPVEKPDAGHPSDAMAPKEDADAHQADAHEDASDAHVVVDAKADAKG